MPFNAEQFLIDTYQSMGIDVSPLSPVYRYLITPVANVFQQYVQSISQTSDIIRQLKDGNVTAESVDLVNELLGMLGLDEINVAPSICTVEITPTLEFLSALRMLSRTFEQDELYFEYDGHTFKNQQFVAQNNPNGTSVFTVEFYCVDPAVSVPTDTIVTLNSNDFETARVVTSQPGSMDTSIDAALRTVSLNLKSPVYGLSPEQVQADIAYKLKLPTDYVQIVSADHPYMFSDLLVAKPPVHIGGFIDVYIKTDYSDVAQILTPVKYSTLHSQIRLAIGTILPPISTNSDYRDILPSDDTNLSNSFLNTLGADYLDKLFAGELNGGDNEPYVLFFSDLAICDISSIQFRGQYLKENVDYTVVSLNRATTFGPHDRILIIFNPATVHFTAGDFVYVNYTVANSIRTYEDILKENHYLCSEMVVKSFIPVWLQGARLQNSSIAGELLNANLSSYAVLSTSTVNSAVQIVTGGNNSLKLAQFKLVTPAFGFFKMQGNVSLQSFQHIVPYPNLMTFATSSNHLLYGVDYLFTD